MGYLPQVAACACWRKANAKLRGVKGPKSKYDVVIPGAGHDGLVAAGYLARAGLVLERNDYVGGATTSQKVFADYEARLSRCSYLVSLLPDKIIRDPGLKVELRKRRTASFTPSEREGAHRSLSLSNVSEAAGFRGIMRR